MTTTRATIENLIAACRDYLGYAQEYQQYSREEIEKNRLVRLSIERLLYLITQSALDLSDAVISYKAYPKPVSFRESFHTLYEHHLIPMELMDQLANMAGFRNVIAHDYLKINYDIVYDVLHHRLDDIKQFLELKGFLPKSELLHPLKGLA